MQQLNSTLIYKTRALESVINFKFFSQGKTSGAPSMENRTGAFKSTHMNGDFFFFPLWGFSPLFFQVEFKIWGWSQVLQQMLLGLWWSDGNLCPSDHHHPVKTKHRALFTSPKIWTTKIIKVSQDEKQMFDLVASQFRLMLGYSQSLNTDISKFAIAKSSLSVPHSCTHMRKRKKWV